MTFYYIIMFITVFISVFIIFVNISMEIHFDDLRRLDNSTDNQCEQSNEEQVKDKSIEDSNDIHIKG